MFIAKNDFRGNVLATHAISNVIYYNNKGLNQIRYYSTSETPELQMFLHNIVLGGTRANSIRSYTRNTGELYVVNNVLNGAEPWWADDEETPSAGVRDHGNNVYTATHAMETGGHIRPIWVGEIKAVNTPLNDIFKYIDAHRDEFGNELVGMSRWDMKAVASWNNNDYRPAEGSILIGGGKPIKSVLTAAGVIGDESWSSKGEWLEGYDYLFETDFSENPWNENPSIGAFEYQGESSSLDTSEKLHSQNPFIKFFNRLFRR